DLVIEAGELVAIMGASGSGKSTLMNLLGCLDRPTSGTYRFMGRDVSGLDRDELAELRREAFGFVFQSYNLIATNTAAENVEVPAMYAGQPGPQRRRRAAELLAMLGLSDRGHHRPNQLSGGQQQRVSIARALMNGAQVILADEPTGALDSKSGADVMALLKRLSADGHTVILITHAPEVARHAQRVIEIRDGNIVADPGPPRLRGAGGMSPAHPSAPAGRAAGPEVPAAPPDPVAAPVDPGAGSARRATARRSSFMADVLESTRTALRALRANVFRAILTLLGIVIGVASVIAMMAIGDGAKQVVIDRISAMGSNLLLVRPGAPNQRGFRNVSTLVLSDVQAIDREVPNVLAAVPEQESTVTMRYVDMDHSTSVIGTSAKYPLVRKWQPARGTFFTDEDEQNYATVAVLGQTVARALFPGGQDPLGQYVLVNNLVFQVIGVMGPRGASPTGQDQDDTVLVPYQTSQLRLSGQRFLRNVTVAVEDVERIDQTQAAVESLLAERHGTIDFQIRNMASIIDTATETQDTMTILLGSIAAISLLVGGIGVMNIMLVSVTERTREIGIRMATGARMRNILQQFLIEALVVSALGGLIGVVIGLAVAAVIGAAGTPVQYSAMPVLLAFGCAFATGLVFGYLPARKAARLDPVVALSSE
ncbi:MAG TPA: MacB family efflux pump subunit, partial [Burkholderiaceae bacterium]|nr:MacB family efflux pump subunit [Burkholderiaceae bacterium]